MYSILKKKSNQSQKLSNHFPLKAELDNYIDSLYINQENIAYIRKDHLTMIITMKNSQLNYKIWIDTKSKQIAHYGEIYDGQELVYYWRKHQPELKYCEWLYELYNDDEQYQRISKSFPLYDYNEELNTMFNTIINNPESIESIKYVGNTVYMSFNNGILLVFDYYLNSKKTYNEYILCKNVLIIETKKNKILEEWHNQSPRANMLYKIYKLIKDEMIIE